MRTSFLALLPIALASPFGQLQQKTKDVYWLLAGDSTTAPGGGWGDGFLATTLAPGSSGTNHAIGGATTLSFRNQGRWDNVIKDIGTYKEKYHVYVTIQFGHNDQKVTSNVTLADYSHNLLRFASEAAQAGATPILVTSLTRRNYNATTGKVIQNLATQRFATIDVAKENRLKFIDLNIASENYVNAIGKESASQYNLAPTDWTHLNPWGEVVFARLVSDLLVEKYGREFEGVTKGNATMSQLLRAGKPV